MVKIVNLTCHISLDKVKQKMEEFGVIVSSRVGVLDIDGFTCTENLRESSQTGGIVLWTRDHTGKAILPWSGLRGTPQSIESERSWVLVNEQHTRFACCGVYLRVESPKSSDLFKSNVTLLEHLEKEKAQLESEGYIVGFFGDFNARIEPNPNFQFSNYPHVANNNGRLLMDFAKRNQLHCLNPLTWKGKKEEKFTYSRDMGQNMHQSIIDYALAPTEAIRFNTSFSVQVVTFNSAYLLFPPSFFIQDY